MSNRRAALVLIAALLLVILGAGPAHARQYSFPALSIEAEVHPDGSMTVTEHRTAEFSGTFRGMYQWIRTGGRTEVADVSVSEGDVSYELNPEEREGPAGTFYVSEKSDSVYVDWSFDATDETRTFTLSYRMLNVVTVHEDVAELYHQFVGDEWEQGVDAVSVRLLLPEGAGPDDVRAWGHGPLYGEVSIISPREVHWEVGPLPAETFLEGRVVFPPQLVPDGSVLSGEEALPGILAEEEELARLANRGRLIARLNWIAAPLILLFSLGGVVWFWLTHGREYRPSFTGDYYRELPADYTPAELGVLWRFGRPGPEDLSATIIDLARKGHLRLEESEREQRGLLRTRKRTDYFIRRLEGEGDLESHEEDLLDFLFTKVSRGGEELSFSDISSYAKTNGQAFGRFWENWESQLAAVGEVRGFFDIRTRTAQIVEFVLAAVLFALGVVAIITGLHASGVAAIVGGVALGIGAAFLRRRSREGLEDFTRWRAFRRFLLHFSEMQRHEVPSLVVWEHYLVYAVTLGVAREVIKQLEIVFPDLRDGSYHFGAGWYYFAARSPSVARMTTGFDSLGTVMQSSLRTAVGSRASGGGFGGGFSGGGGGGTGGGGGGVR
ncbi:MAG: DUF2207 domain-containing protein [Bacillota bacterium]